MASSSPFLLLSLNHSFLLPPASHKKTSFLQSPSPSQCAASVTDGTIGPPACHAAHIYPLVRFVSTCNSWCWHRAWTAPRAPGDGQRGGSLQPLGAVVRRMERWGEVTGLAPKLLKTKIILSSVLRGLPSQRQLHPDDTSVSCFLILKSSANCKASLMHISTPAYRSLADELRIYSDARCSQEPKIRLLMPQPAPKR